MNRTRFVGLSGFSMVMILVLFYAVVLFVPDRLNPDDPPWNIGHKILGCVCAIAVWPLVAVWLVVGDSLPATGITGILVLWAVSGMFWGMLMELYLARIERRSTIRSSEPPSHASVL